MPRTPRPPVPRSLRALALVAGLAVAATACSSVEEPAAVTVDGTEVDAGRVQDELALLADNQGYRDLLQQQLQVPLEGAGRGTFDSAFVAQLLSVNVYFALVDDELAARDVTLSEEDLQAARRELTGGSPTAPEGQPVLSEDDLASLPGWFQRTLLRRNASLPKLSDVLAEGYYDEHPDEFTPTCVSQILASVEQRGEDGALARIQDLAQRIRDGADFAQLAGAETDDPFGKTNGGNLGCGPRGRLVAPLEEAVAGLAPGEVSEPVLTEFGYHLLRVTNRQRLELDQVRDQAGASALNEFLQEAAAESDVEVDPRYGSWVTGGERGELARVVPPEGPAPPGDGGDGAPGGPVP